MMLLRGLARVLGRAVDVPTGWTPTRFYPFAPLLGAQDESPLSFPAFKHGLDLKGSMVGRLPVYTEVNGQRRDYVPPILWQPDPTEARMTTIAKMVQSFVYCGEVVAPITAWDERGYAQSLVVVDPSCATLSPDGMTWRIGTLEFSRFDVLHLVRFPVPGSLRGVGSIALNRTLFNGVAAQERFQRDYYLNGGVPSVVVHMAEGASGDDLALAKANYLERVSKREPLLVPGGMKVEAFQLSNLDMQYVASKQFTLNEMALIVGLPGYFLGVEGSSNTYSNVQDAYRQLVDMYLAPDIYLLEWGFSSLLADGMKARFDTNTLLRTDPDATASLLIKQMEYMTMNEVRAIVGLPPVPGGDVIAKQYVVPTSEATAEARALSVAEVLQKVYLAVGVVISAEEAREIVNANGGNLTGPAPAAALPPAPSEEGAQ